MSELKVDQITGLGGSLKINDPLGIGTTPRQGYELTTNGNVLVDGTVEVVTVPSVNFGIKIKAAPNSLISPGFGDSTLQFTNNQGVDEWASLHATNDRGLNIKTNGVDAIRINSSQATTFLGNLVANQPSTFNSTTAFQNTATFSNQVPRCNILPTVGEHLANKTYVDSVGSNNTLVVSMSNGAPAPVSKTVNLKSGRWVAIFTSCVQFMNDQRYTSTTSTQTASSSLFSITNAHYFHKSGDAGHGRALEVTSSTASEFTVSASGNYTFNISLPTQPISRVETRGATLLLLFLGV
jgi:hypothetical protein